jgi:hypothetical protein
MSVTPSDLDSRWQALEANAKRSRPRNWHRTDGRNSNCQEENPKVLVHGQADDDEVANQDGASPIHLSFDS